MPISEREGEAQVRAWGFTRVITWSDPPNAHYPPHTHPKITTHLVLKGKITLQEDGKEKKTYKKGDRADVGANVKHEAWIGSGGCTYVIGE